jgi:hypothetical protein
MRRTTKEDSAWRRYVSGDGERRGGGEWTGGRGIRVDGDAGGWLYSIKRTLCHSHCEKISAQGTSPFPFPVGVPNSRTPSLHSKIYRSQKINPDLATLDFVSRPSPQFTPFFLCLFPARKSPLRHRTARMTSGAMLTYALLCTSLLRWGGRAASSKSSTTLPNGTTPILQSHVL